MTEPSAGKTLILASGSPRRATLLAAFGYPFMVEPTHASEELPPDIPANDAALLLARRKAHAHRRAGETQTIILAADTVVISEKTILNKPSSADEAFHMLSSLSGKTHTVTTGICMVCGNEEFAISESSHVTFLDLSRAEIDRYITEFRPLDKAGAYGIQETMSVDMDPCNEEEKNLLTILRRTDLISDCRKIPAERKPVVLIRALNGSFFNVMGLPLISLYAPLSKWMKVK